jgi:hypothetical protein
MNQNGEGRSLDITKSTPLASLLLLTLLGVIASVLIVPQVDLPDAAFHGKSAPVVMRAAAHAALQRNASSVPDLLFRLESDSDQHRIFCSGECVVEISLEPHHNLRC